MRQRPKVPSVPRLRDPEANLSRLNTFMQEVAQAIGDTTPPPKSTKPRASAVPVPPDATSSLAVPLIPYYRAGHELDDGTWLAEMYWDDRRERMLVDNFVLAPDKRENWGGVQFWIKTPAAVVPATGLAPIEQFHDESGGKKSYRETIAIEPQFIPPTPETWEFIAASADADGNIVKDSTGVPRGPRVALVTLPKADNVQDPRVSVQIRIDEAGDQVFRLVGSWINPPVPRYKGVRIIMRGLHANDTPIYDAAEGETGFVSEEFPVPASGTNLTIFFVPIFGDGTLGNISTSPSVTVTVSRIQGSFGEEFAPRVFEYGGTVLGYTNNYDGQRVLRVRLTWDNPADVRFGGVIIYVDWVDGNRYQISGIERGTSFIWETTHFPTTNTNATFYLLSVDTNNRRNTLRTDGFTPSVTLTIPVPGFARVSEVGNFNATANRVTTSDGTRPVMISVSFDPPTSDRRWGGVNIKTSNDTGPNPTWRLRASASRESDRTNVSFYEPDPLTSGGLNSLTIRVAAFSYDVNGVENPYQAGVTPEMTLFYGGMDLLDLTNANPNTFNQAQFNKDLFRKFQIFSVHGDLIVSGTIASRHIVTNGIDIGPLANMPGRFRVFNSAGQQIGFIGTDMAWSGGWFKQLAVGGNGPSSAPLKADSTGTLSWTYNQGASTIVLSPNNAEAPIEITNLSHVTYVGGQFVTGGIMAKSAGLATAYMRTYGSAVAWGAKLHLEDAAEPSRFATLDVQHNNVFGFAWALLDLEDVSGAGFKAVAAFNVSDRKLEIKRLPIRIVSSNYPGGVNAVNASVNYKKADDTVGTLTFENGILVGAT
jgi:hypothetical protein